MSDAESASYDMPLPGGFSMEHLEQFDRDDPSPHFKTTSEQQGDLLSLIKDGIADCNSKKWSSSVVYSVREFFDGHCKTSAVLWTAALRGVPFNKASKSETIDSLMKYQVVPMSYDEIREMALKFDNLSAEEQHDLASKPAPDLPYVFDSEDDDDAESNRAEQSEDSGSDNDASYADSEMAPGSYRELVAAMKLNRDVLVKFVNGGVDRPAVGANASGSDKQSLSPYDKHVKELHDNIKGRKYIEVIGYAAVFLDQLKYSEQSASDKVTKIGGITISGVSKTKKDLSRVFDWDLFASGFNFYIQHLSKIMPELVADRMGFLYELENWPEGSGEDKVRLAKHFFSEHKAKGNWLSIFKQDATVVLKFLRPSSKIAFRASSLSDAERKRLGLPSFKLSKPFAGGAGNKRGSPAAEANARQRGGKRPRPSMSSKSCFSRSRRDHGECTYDPCRFSHKCIMCSQDHSAASCPTWDQNVVDAKLKSNH